MTMMTIQSQVTGILSLAACRLYGEPARSCNVRGLQPVTTRDDGKQCDGARFPKKPLQSCGAQVRECSDVGLAGTARGRPPRACAIRLAILDL